MAEIKEVPSHNNFKNTKMPQLNFTNKKKSVRAELFEIKQSIATKGKKELTENTGIKDKKLDSNKTNNKNVPRKSKAKKNGKMR